MSSLEALPLERREPTDGSPRAIVFAGCGLAGGILVVLAVALGVFRLHYGDGALSRRAPPVYSFEHGPHELTGIERDWQAQETLVRSHLSDYGWVDRQAGVVRIPIERAMQLTATDAERTGHAERKEKQ